MRWFPTGAKPYVFNSKENGLTIFAMLSKCILNQEKVEIEAKS
jgi:hypothetical protein